MINEILTKGNPESKAPAKYGQARYKCSYQRKIRIIVVEHGFALKYGSDKVRLVSKV